MDLTFYVFFLVGVSVGLGSSTMANLFFIFSHPRYEIKAHELHILQRLQLVAIVSSSIAIISRLIYASLQFEQHLSVAVGVESALILILGILLISNLLLRKFHIPALIRHQQRHSHLSDAFKNHHDALISSSTLCLVSWIVVVCVAGIEARVDVHSLNFLTIFFTYAVISFISIQIAQKIKGFYQIS